MKAALYLRVSTQEQKYHGISVDSQLKALTDYCEQNGYEPVIYNDAGISAHISYKRRPAMLDMIRDCQEGKIDIILLTKLDRFFRSVPDYYEVMAQLNGVPWKTIWEDYDSTSSDGIFRINLFLSLAQQEAEKTSERTKAVVEYKRSRGDYVGKAPIGYKIVNKQLVKDPKTEEAVKAIFSTYLTTWSSSEAVLEAQKHGLNISRYTLLPMVKRTAYMGNASGYKCEPYITEEEHELILSHSSETTTRTSKYPDRTYLFSGLVFCDKCGFRMSGHACRRTYSTRTVYHKRYECRNDRKNCSHHSIHETVIEKYLLERVEELLRAYNLSYEEVYDNSDNMAKIKRRNALQDKLKRLANLYADGDIELDEYRAKRDSIKRELSSIRIQEHSKQELPEDWKQIYADLDDFHKQMFWQRLIRRINVDSNGNINLIFK